MPPLVQIIACRMSGAKTLSEPKVCYNQINLKIPPVTWRPFYSNLNMLTYPYYLNDIIIFYCQKCQLGILGLITFITNEWVFWTNKTLVRLHVKFICKTWWFGQVISLLVSSANSYDNLLLLCNVQNRVGLKASGWKLIYRLHLSPIGKS